MEQENILSVYPICLLMRVISQSLNYNQLYIYIRYQGGLGVSTHSKSSSARVHLYYCLSDKYVIKVA